MKEKIGKHSLLKEINKKAILELISEEYLSCQDISNKSGLSYTGVGTLLEEMLSDKLLIKLKDIDVNGRKGIVYSINPHAGMFFILKLVENCKIILFSLDGKELETVNLNIVGKINMTHIENVKNIMNELIKKYSEHGALVRITIIGSGKINKRDGSFMHSPAFENYKEMNLKNYFSEAFSTSVDIKNDIRFSLIAEKASGKYRDIIKDTLYLQLGTGISSAMFLDGNLYEGSSGLNGEIGYFIVDAVSNSSNYLQTNTLNYYLHHASYPHILEVINFALKKGVESSLSGKDEITIADVAKEYNNNDKLCLDVVNASISITACVIKSLAEVLDFANVIISRETMFFGEKYIETLSKILAQFDDISKIDIYLSTYDISGVVLGAKQYAMKKIIANISNNSIKDKLSNVNEQ